MKKFTVLVLSLLLLIITGCGGDSSSSSTPPPVTPQEEEENPTPNPSPTPTTSGSSTVRCYVQEPVGSPYELAYLIKKNGGNYSYSRCNGSLNTCVNQGALVRFTEGGDNAVSCFTSGPSLDFQTCVRNDRDYVNTSFGRLVGMLAIRERDIGFYLYCQQKIVNLMLPVPVTCPYFHDNSGDAELDTVFAGNVNYLRSKGWVPATMSGRYLLNLGTATCGSQDCVQLSVDKLPIPENRLYQRSRLGLNSKAEKGRSLIRSLPSCRDFKRIYE